MTAVPLCLGQYFAWSGFAQENCETTVKNDKWGVTQRSWPVILISNGVR